MKTILYALVGALILFLVALALSTLHKFFAKDDVGRTTPILSSKPGNNDISIGSAMPYVELTRSYAKYNRH